MDAVECRIPWQPAEELRALDKRAIEPGEDLVRIAEQAMDGGDVEALSISPPARRRPKNKADSFIAPIRKAGKPIVDNIRAIDYVTLQRSTDISDPRARGMYLKSGFTEEITPEAIKDILAGFEPNPHRAMTVHYAHAGGAIGDVATDATAFPHRYAKHDLLAILDWPVETDPAEHIAYLKDYWATLERHTSGFYTNNLFTHSGEEIHENYRGNYERLVQIKNTYDPTNLFRLNANVQPTV